MKIVDFTYAHITEATALALANYEEERRHVPALPQIDAVLNLSKFADNKLGVAALDGDKMVGFLCSYKPFNNAFGSTRTKGIFSPMDGNAATRKNRAKIYAAMYEEAAKKWVQAGAVIHAVNLYAHDTAAQHQFYLYGFGLRCVDAIRSMDEIIAPHCTGYDFSELAPDELPQILPLDHMLDAHMAASPTFILRPSDTQEALAKKIGHFQSTFFVAKHEGKIVAYLRAELDGETFLCDTSGYLHIKGAYCLPEYRGKGLNQILLSLLIQKLRTQGYVRLGVDFESINPTAYGFWLKHFDAYTHSVVRRIDENILEADI